MSGPVSLHDVQVSARGDLSPEDVRYAREKISAVLRLAPEQVLAARVRLVRSVSVRPSVLAQANLDVNGRAVRAQVHASTAVEAADLLVDRLRRQLTAMARHWEALRGGQPRVHPNEWRHGGQRRQGPPPPPAGGRQVVRRKSFTLPRCTVEEAAFEMNLMDYDFHLFTEAATGQDCVLYHAEGADYRLARAQPQAQSADPGPTGISLTVSEVAAPRLTVAQATERLELSGRRFVFFVDDASGRGGVLYLRHDGNIGLITPVDDTASK